MSRLDPDAPFKSFQKRLCSHELHTPQLNDANRKRFGLQKQIVLDAYPADSPGTPEGWQGEWTKWVAVSEN